MNLSFPLFPLAALMVLAAAGQPALATGMPAAVDPAVHLNAVGIRNSFNGLSREDQRDLLAVPESESPPQGGSRGQAMTRAQRCDRLEQQVQREPIIAPDFYPYADLSRTYPGQPNREPNGARPNYAEPNGRERGNASLLDVFFPSSDKGTRSQRREPKTRYADMCGK